MLAMVTVVVCASEVKVKVESVVGGESAVSVRSKMRPNKLDLSASWHRRFIQPAGPSSPVNSQSKRSTTSEHLIIQADSAASATLTRARFVHWKPISEISLRSQCARGRPGQFRGHKDHRQRQRQRQTETEPRRERLCRWTSHAIGVAHGLDGTDLQECTAQDRVRVHGTGCICAT